MATAEAFEPDPTHTPTPEAAHVRLEHFPISFFAITMGLSGLTLALLRLEHSAEISHTLSIGALIAASASAIIVALFYFAKIIRHPQAVRAEWHHPVRLSFFPAASISLILLATAVFPFSQKTSLVLWSTGTTLHFLGTLAVVSAWISHRPFEIPHLNPAWFIPAVGNVLVPVVGVKLGYVEVSWFFFSVGMVFWLILLTLIFNRLIFHNPMPGRLFPTMVILIAPPAVGFIAYTRLIGDVDPFARMLYYAGVMFAILVITQLPRLARLDFALSWWAYSFPVAALTISTFLYAEMTHSDWHRYAAYGVFSILGLVIALLVVRTIVAIAAGKICEPE
ncbi:MAG: SLAC1 anion channel family protein [Alphaproteobacteria bacterium]